MNQASPSHRPRTYFVSRHPGAVEWAQRQGICVDHIVDHLDINIIRADDIVIGTLPIHMVVSICAQGARYFHLTLSLPPSLRGQELSADMLEQLGAELQEYEAKVPSHPLPLSPKDLPTGRFS